MSSAGAIAVPKSRPHRGRPRSRGEQLDGGLQGRAVGEIPYLGEQNRIRVSGERDERASPRLTTRSWVDPVTGLDQCDHLGNLIIAQRAAILLAPGGHGGVEAAAGNGLLRSS